VPCARRTLMDPRGLWAPLARLALAAWVWLVGVLGRLKAPFPLPTCPPYSDCFIALIYKTTVYQVLISLELKPFAAGCSTPQMP